MANQLISQSSGILFYFHQLMTYMIYENNLLKTVGEDEYERWLEEKADEYVLPVYKKVIDSTTYIVDTDYQGVFEDGKQCCPFVLYTLVDLHNNEEPEEDTEYFDSFYELNKRREKLIAGIEEKLLQ